MLDEKFIRRKIDLIQEDLEKLETFRKLTFTQVAKDWLRYHALKNLFMEIIGRGIDINFHLVAELSKVGAETPKDYKDSFLALGELGVLPKKFSLQIAESAGFRNAIVHGYNKLDKYIVYKTIGEAIDQYAKYCDYILKFLSKHSSKK
ncbi:MAG: type VII toxin-antitoxin system HepT family RNase toxin [Microgenomates group bacterium]